MMSYSGYEIPAIFVLRSTRKTGQALRGRWGHTAPDTEATTVAHRVILLVDDDPRFAELTKTFLACMVEPVARRRTMTSRPQVAEQLRQQLANGATELGRVSARWRR